MPGAEQIRSHAGLRGVAALLVVAYHLQFADQRLAIEDATDFFKRGYLFVDLFFVLSGFIISYTNGGDRPRPLTAARYRDFIGRRFVRLYPLLIFTIAYLIVGRLAISAGYQAMGRPDPVPHESLGLLLAQVMMINAWVPGSGSWNLPSWSISAEMFAYALFPVLIAVRARMPRLGMALLALPPLAFYGWIATHAGSLDIISGLAPFRCLAGFSLGMIVFQLRERFAARPGACTVAQIASVVAIMAMLAVRVNDVLLVPFFALLVGTTWQDKGPIARLLASRGPVALGDISYSVYLNHTCLLGLIGIPWGSAERALHLDPALARIAWITTSFAVVLAASRLTYRYVEIPGRKWLAARLLGHPVRSIVHAPPGP